MTFQQLYRSVIQPAVMLALLAGWSASSAAPTASTNAAPIVVSLEFQKVSYPIINSGISITERSSAFKKEPLVNLMRVRRGQMGFLNSREPGMAFVWDRSANRLYLDLNRNEDLTDDPDGVFSSAHGSGYSSYALFTNVSLLMPAEADSVPLVVDLQFSEYRKQLNVYAMVKAFWSGKVVLSGREWQVGVVRPLEGGQSAAESRYLLFRPWDRRNQPFRADGNSPEAFQFRKNLFVQEHLYSAALASNPEGDQPIYQLTLTEQPAELGEVQLSGSFIQRLVLNGPSLVELDTPGKTIRVPVGNYSIAQVQLANSNVIARWESSNRGNLPHPAMLNVTNGRPARLAAGGPLTNSVTVRSRGSYLVFDYKLIGAGGAEYQIESNDRSHPPKFAVYRGDKKIASGNFEFG